MKVRLVILLAAVVLPACADDGVGPRRSTPRAAMLTQMPLAIGNAWTYDLTRDGTYINEDGTEARPSEHYTATGTRSITGTDTVSGREYVVETFTAAADGQPPFTQWRRFRQDDDAFYQADLSTSVPPGEVPADLDFGELIRLRFPVAVGDSWELRPGSEGVVLTVEARDTLSLAFGERPAWRIRLDSAFARPDDYTTLWFGTEGLLRRVDHVEFDAVDVGTGEVVHITLHDEQELVGLDLVECP